MVLLADLLGAELAGAVVAEDDALSAAPALSAADAAASWAASGLARLTGRPGGPDLPPPLALVAALRDLPEALRWATSRHGAPVVVDGLALLRERARATGFRRGGARSVGGASRLLRCADGWIAVSLARPEDIDSVPAWLGVEPPPDREGCWTAVADAVATHAAAPVVERARLLAMPVAAVGDMARSAPAIRLNRLGDDLREPIGRQPLVVDLSSLWAGPLCGRLLRMTGARVVKVEGADRPDGARFGPRSFFALMNDGKESVVVDLRSADGVAELRALLAAADVVIEASRPRALEQIGLDAASLKDESTARAWVSITGYGRSAPEREWVAFGDDAAAAGGLVVWDDDGPCFCADAVADPLTGLLAATAASIILATGGRWLVDVALARSAAAVAGGPLAG
ncbi:MAG: CoA transferase [Acidimicrobiia bacterium]